MFKAIIHLTFSCLATITAALAQPPPKRLIFVIDSVPIKRATTYFLKPQNIKTIGVSKKRSTTFRDTIFITLKDHKSFLTLHNSEILSPDDIARKYIPNYNSKSQVLFVWNDKLLIDTAEVGVPEQYFERAEILKASKTAYAKTLPKAIIIKVYTKTP